MSEADHHLIKRIVRRVLAKTLELSQDASESLASKVVNELQKECGGDRLYVPAPALDEKFRTRNDRIREVFEALHKNHGSRFAYEMLMRKEALSLKQLRRICQPAASDPQSAS